MQTDEVVARICRLPIDFYVGTKSMVQLVADSGIETQPASLSLANLTKYIGTHPEVVESWLRWSENKRVTSGWFFSRHGDRFDVGFFPQGELLAFADPTVACAEFMIREVGALMAIRRQM
jgi:hypothetical protein